MGSVTTYQDCPRCNAEEESFFIDCYYKTGEEYAFCSLCGYGYSHTIKRDENGEPVLLDPKKGVKHHNIVFESKEHENPFGAYRIKYENSIGFTVGCLPNEKEYLKFKNYCNNSLMKNSITHAEVSKLLNGKIVKEVICENV